jgi:monoamine oxidase
MPRGALSGTQVVVAGAGLAGLTAARDLAVDGASVTIVDARDRVGGRILTIREGFAHGQYAEAGADLIEESQTDVRALARELGLDVVRILRNGWGFFGPDRRNRRRIHSAPSTFEDAARFLRDEITSYRLANERWDSAVGVTLGRQTVADWFGKRGADLRLMAGLRGLRGFFLADPEDLSLLPLVEQFAADGAPGADRIYRLRGGGDRLPTALARSFKGSILLNTIVRQVTREEGSVRIAIEDRVALRELRADFLVCAIPAATLRDVRFDPPLESDRQRAISTLRYGKATRLLLQFERRFWRRGRRPWAFGTDLPIGAVWDANEQQRGPAGILTLLAGGRASVELQELLSAEGVDGVRERLAWLGRPSRLLASHAITWESDPWACGGYAYFDSSFDPRLRAWLARPAGRVLFAGEHTSDRWQGYMSGAIESGHRAAAEVRVMVTAG